MGEALLLYSYTSSLYLAKKMRKLFWAVALLWMSACATFHGLTHISPAPYYSIGYTWAWKSLDSDGVYSNLPSYTVKPDQRVTVIGHHREWSAVETADGQVWVPTAALVPEDGSHDRVTLETIYPKGLATQSIDYSYNIWASFASEGTPSYIYHDVYTGPRGGQYYINGNGNRQYITPTSTVDREEVRTGPRGGQYYINANGNKTYIKK